jgi:hypothetical protein
MCFICSIKSRVVVLGKKHAGAGERQKSVMVDGGVEVHLAHLLVDPCPEQGHVGVDAGGAVLAAPDAPRDDSRLREVARTSRHRTHQWTATVALQIFSNFSSMRHIFF